MKLNKIYCVDCAKGMKKLDDGVVDLTVTSPPYDDMRTYNGYTFDFEATAKELFRIIKKGGVVVWIVGDQTNGSETGTSFRQALYFRDVCGFNLHDTMIFQKAGARHPSSSRYYQTFEYMFIFSKGKPKTFNPIKDRRNKWIGGEWGKSSSRHRDGRLVTKSRDGIRPIELFGVRFNIWKYNTGFDNGTKDKIAKKHPAIFPEKLAKDHIISWSNEGDLVFDPMCGSGTTCKMAKLLNRRFLGFDVSQEYVDIANKRVKTAASIRRLIQ